LKINRNWFARRFATQGIAHAPLEIQEEGKTQSLQQALWTMHTEDIKNHRPHFPFAKPAVCA